MQIYISEEAIIGDIQERFHRLYPRLKLEFFRKPHAPGACSPEKDKLPANTPIEKVRMQHSFGWLDVSHYRTAVAVEHDLKSLFGLHAQVLHKAGALWLQTTGTGHLTLEELNAGDAEKAVFELPEEPENE
ncbi:hypothetical protein HF324_03325 [Chitinophaga oryzae]|uniref:Uncharacterized protein n=1 Tax=Chitinophaga oryzae TaxID=2725414 RepID=A0AAE6ZCQ0_9BACT|nr:hypothetical protein [Chitinophaga oryzae]QJB30428.1 hypothetical protein HF329_03565 [Chitinophaga oryzae]QJB36938.1 hypothetical protein HF324_03325 [Chitinophaga oryzae]